MDLRQIDPGDLRRNVGSVLQDVWLHTGTVRDNIAIGDAGETTRAAAIEVNDAGQIFIAGNTTDATFTGAGVDGRLTHSGSSDAFVARFDGTTGAMDFGAYVGSTGADKAQGLALSGSEIYLVGQTQGDLQGNTLIGSQDGFLARLDTNGAPLSVTTISGINGHAELNGITVDESGDSVLTKLGLGHGDIGDLGSLTVTSNSAVRPGMSFTLAIGDGPERSIEIEADDSIRWVAFQMNRILGKDGIAEVKKDGDSEFLRITAKGDREVKIGGGPEGFDALPGLGLREGSIFGKEVKDDKSFFALGFGFGEEGEGLFGFGLGIVEEFVGGGQSGLGGLSFGAGVREGLVGLVEFGRCFGDCLLGLFEFAGDLVAGGGGFSERGGGFVLGGFDFELDGFVFGEGFLGSGEFLLELLLRGFRFFAFGFGLLEVGLGLLQLGFGVGESSACNNR